LAFQKFRTEKAKVLYVSLEDGPRRLQTRLLRIQPNLRTPDGLDFLYEFPRLGDGALEAFQHYGKAYQVIILDVLGRILPQMQSVRKQMSEYQEFTEHLGPIQQFAQQAHIAILIIDHVRKASADDIFDTIIGSQGKWGAADNGLVYERKGEDKDGVLHTAGRDIEEQKVVLTMLEGRLEFLGKGESFEMDSEQNRIIKILEEEHRPMGIPEIMRAMGLGEQHYKRFRVVMHRLYNEDRIGRTKKRGLYTLYGHDRQADWEDKDLETVPF
jgi:AAA domain